MADADRVQMPVAGGRVFCEVAGAGPPVVLTHDGLLHRESWDAHFAALSPRYRVARWDRRGYGLSDQPGTAYSSADDLARVIRHVADSPATLVGCSYGALVSLRCALDHPDLVAALVLVGPVVTGLELTPHFLTRGGRERPADEASVADHIAYWCDDPWFVAAANTSARQRLQELLEANPHNLLPKASLDQTGTEPLLPRLHQMTAPTLVVVGEGDIPDVHAHAGAIASHISGAVRVVLTTSGHLPHLETPDEFHAIVSRFLAEVA